MATVTDLIVSIDGEISSIKDLHLQISTNITDIETQIQALKVEVANLLAEIDSLKAIVVAKDAEIKRLSDLLNQPVPTPTPTPTPSTSASATPTPTPSRSVGVTVTPTPSSSTTRTPTPTPTKSPVPVSATPTPTPSSSKPAPTPTLTIGPVSFDTTNAFSVYNTPARPGDRTVKVFVVLDRPADSTKILNYWTSNGSGTWNSVWEPANSTQGNYIGKEGILIFQPGDKVKAITIRLLTDLNATQNININIDSYLGWPSHNFKNKSAKIVGDPNRTIAMPNYVETNATIPARPTNMVKIFDDNLLTNFAVNDTGRRPDGSKCWRSRLYHGREQGGNKEVGYYADPVLNPGTNGFVIGADGKRVIQAEYIPGGVKNQAGQIMTYDYGAGRQNYVHSAVILHSNDYFQLQLNEYVEARIKLEAKPSTWPAFWLLPEDYSWPALEIDIFEGFFNSGKTPRINGVPLTVHWNPNHQMYSNPARFDIVKNDPNFKVTDYHTYGCHVAHDWITAYIDDAPYFRMPNMTDRSKKMSLLFNIAVGGLVGTPTATENATYPARMSIEWVRAWRYA
jgi:Glycosyl hydrolases family 16